MGNMNSADEFEIFIDSKRSRNIKRNKFYRELYKAKDPMDHNHFQGLYIKKYYE